MTGNNRAYIGYELLAAQETPLKDGSLRIQIVGEHGKTKWLTLDTIAARAIEDVLMVMAVRMDEAGLTVCR